MEKLDSSCEVVFFASSSGHCVFDCRYCIINPIAKNQPSLDYGDFRFLLDFFNVKAFFAFSGIGDFFASYNHSQKLLGKLLDHDVEIALDVNGALLQDFQELSSHKLDKIRYINLTMHYHQIKEKKILERWQKNALTLIERRFDQIHPDYILSPALIDEWEDALEYYARSVFVHTGKPVLLVRDIHANFDLFAEERIKILCKQFGEVITSVHQEDFSANFASRQKVLCPAGVRYFRLWNDGRVQGCPNLPAVASLTDCGNLKERRLTPSGKYFMCDSPRFCDCHVIDGLGKMRDHWSTI